jgi:mediator of RNA polymerase II transcription subunit 16
LVAEKKDSTLYSEKFSHLRFAPSVRHFGGRPLDGCVVVSSTGMVGAVALSREGFCGTTRTMEQVMAMSQFQALTASESLGSIRHRITAVDICYGKSKFLSCSLMLHTNMTFFTDGHFLVAVSGGSTTMPVQCYRVSVKKVEDKMTVISQALPSFFLQCNTLKDNGCELYLQSTTIHNNVELLHALF